MKYNKGEILAFSTGVYSNYGVAAFTEVLKDFDEKEVGEAYLLEHPTEREGYRFIESAFINYLTLKGFVKDIPYKEWRYSDYSNLQYTDTE